MKRLILAHPAAVAALIAAGALLPASLSAQETPPVQSTVPAPPPVAAPAPATPSVVFSPRREVAQPGPSGPAQVEAPAAAPEATRSERARPLATRRPVPARAATVAAPVAAAPAAPLAVETAPPAPLPEPVVGAPETAPVAVDQPAETVTDGSGLPGWLFPVAALAVILGLAGLILSRRRRREPDEVFESGTYVATDETGTPLPSVDLDERPWIRLAIQPTASQVCSDGHEVAYELIVENEGRVPAHDVKVSSFLTGASATSLAGLASGGSETHRIDLAPGESRPLPGSISVPEGASPKIVADARYPLPGGGEGHLAARFGIDVSEDLPPAEVEDVLERV